MSGLKTLTWRTLSVATLLLSANAASADFLYGNSGSSGSNGVNRLTVNGSVELYSGENQGWWSATSPNSSSSEANYFVGLIDEGMFGTHLLNNFFIFDISGLSGPVSSAVLSLQFYTAKSTSGASSLTYGLFDVSTDFATLNNNVGTSSAIFNDLGSGASYGKFLIPISLPSDAVVSLALTGAGLADLNAAIENKTGKFAIGGTLLAPEPTDHSNVPDSTSTLVLFFAAIAGIWALRRNTKLV